MIPDSITVVLAWIGIGVLVVGLFAMWFILRALEDK
jgi:uncharacterized membrane protein